MCHGHVCFVLSALLCCPCVLSCSPGDGVIDEHEFVAFYMQGKLKDAKQKLWGAEMQRLIKAAMAVQASKSLL